MFSLLNTINLPAKITLKKIFYLCIYVIQILIRQINFNRYFPNKKKLKSFLTTFHSYNNILIFEYQLCMYNVQYGFLYLILTRPKLTVQFFRLFHRKKPPQYHYLAIYV
jgi:hypothetical protein